jgi:hypothetical protein
VDDAPAEYVVRRLAHILCGDDLIRDNFDGSWQCGASNDFFVYRLSAGRYRLDARYLDEQDLAKVIDVMEIVTGLRDRMEVSKTISSAP